MTLISFKMLVKDISSLSVIDDGVVTISIDVTQCIFILFVLVVIIIVSIIIGIFILKLLDYYKEKLKFNKEQFIIKTAVERVGRINYLIKKNDENNVSNDFNITIKYESNMYE